MRHADIDSGISHSPTFLILFGCFLVSRTNTEIKGSGLMDRNAAVSLA